MCKNKKYKERGTPSYNFFFFFPSVLSPNFISLLKKMNPSDPSTFNHQYANVNGIRMPYVDENQSSKKALLLIHGWPDL